MKGLVTTKGVKTKADLGMILPHEHVFVDLRTPDQLGYAEADAVDVVALMAPQIEAIKALGFTALVECSTGGVGRRADFDLAVSNATNFPIVVPTGNYREPWIPDWVKAATDAELENWMVRELDEGIDDTGFRAGWVKLSAGDDGITPLEERILRAGARAAKRFDAVIGSHTIKGRVVMNQLDIIEAEGYRADRFISIHTQAEPDFELHLAIAGRGAFIEYDNIGSGNDDELIELIHKVIQAGFENQLLLSHDRGWYDPAQPGGGIPKPYTYLSEIFLPQLRASGIEEGLIKLLTEDNPYNAFARLV